MLAVQADNSIEAPTTIEWWKGLPFRFESVSVTASPQAAGFRFSKFNFTIEALLEGRKLVVAGEDNDSETAMAKAIAELVERAALLTAPRNGIYVSNSNGWAAHPDGAQARLNAIFEVIERDAVLAQWYSKTPFLELDASAFPGWLQSWVAEELSRSEYPRMRVLLSTRGLGPSVTCVFMNDDGYGICSHATRATLDGSIQSATAEACRAALHALRRSCWNDTVALRDGAQGRVEPIAHGLYYAFHERLPSWMFGRSIGTAEAREFWANRMEEFAGLESQFSFTRVLETPLVVGAASHPLAFTLSWGTTNRDQVSQSAGGMRLGLKSEAINTKPHIVS